MRLPLLALVGSTRGRTVEKTAVRWVRVAVRVVPACPMGKATNSTRPQFLLRAAMREEYFLVLASILVLQPKSLKKPISTTMRVHKLLLLDDGYGCGESGTPLA
jgi:hypothetical protein